MNNSMLGRLEKVDLREIWETEASDFTPWLAQEENIKLLGDSIGLELDVEVQEKEVGPFRADILCKDTANDHWVLIENQLERTDHVHLGQLLTYAAGLDAVTIAWVAAKFTDEHRAALDWLNEITEERFDFFGLEVELWRIGGSQVAPKFNVVCKPNDWVRSVSGAAKRLSDGTLTETKLLQQEFWRRFREYLVNNESVIRPTKPFPQHWMNMALGRSGVHLSAIVSKYNSEKDSYDQGEIRAEVVLNDSNAKAFFELLSQQKNGIESELGEELIWYNPSDKRMCRIYLRKDADIQNQSKWPEQHAWLKEKLEKLRQAFQQRVRQLDPDSVPVDIE